MRGLQISQIKEFTEFRKNWNKCNGRFSDRFKKYQPKMKV
jgi:hypothetical protein